MQRRASSLAVLFALLAALAPYGGVAAERNPPDSACAREDAPVCATSATRFAGTSDFDACQLAMTRFEASIKRYQACRNLAAETAAKAALDRARSDNEAAVGSYNAAAAIFNNKARGN